MVEFALPNEVMLEISARDRLRTSIERLVAGSLSTELADRTWTVTRAESCETSQFLDDMQFFSRQHPFEHKQLGEAIEGRTRIGVFQFQLTRNSEMDSLPEHFVGQSLLVVIDETESVVLWRFISLVSR